MPVAAGGIRAGASTKKEQGKVMQRLMPYLLVGLGSFVGGNARYAVARWVGGIVEGRFPLGTFLINVGGSFVLGFLGGAIADRVNRQRLLMTTQLLAGLLYLAMLWRHRDALQLTVLVEELKRKNRRTRRPATMSPDA